MVNIFGLLQTVRDVKCGEQCKEAATKITKKNFYMDREHNHKKGLFNVQLNTKCAVLTEFVQL